MIEPYDTEYLEIEELFLDLQQRLAGTSRNFNTVEQEIKERFAGIGFRVEVNWYRYAVNGTEVIGGGMPEITIVERLAKGENDYDRRVHEAIRNVLELPGESGVIKTDKETVQRFLEGHSKAGHAHDAES